MNVYTHLGLEDATEELRKIEAFRKAQAEVNKPVKQSAFKVVWEKVILWDVFILLVKPVSGIGIGIWECYIIRSN